MRGRGVGIFPGSMELGSPVYGRKSRKKVLFKGWEDKDFRRTRVQGNGQGGHNDHMDGHKGLGMR